MLDDVLIAYYALAGGTVILWSPILLKFYKNWLKRHNPISLAICAAVTLLMWLAVAGVWAVVGDVRVEVVTFVSTAVSLAVALYANFTFYWAEKRFTQKRKGE